MISKTMRRTTIAAVLTALVIVIVSCNPAKKYEEEEKDRIAEYVAKNNITVNPDANGLYYIETVPGTGDLIKTGDSVGAISREYAGTS